MITSPPKISTIRIPQPLDEKITAVAAAVKLSKADTARLSLERGLDILLAQLRPAPAAPLTAEPNLDC